MKTKGQANKSGIIRHRLAHVLRALSAEVTACDAPDELFSEMADWVERLCSDLIDMPNHCRKVHDVDSVKCALPSNRGRPATVDAMIIPKWLLFTKVVVDCSL